jgi:hypothetical protein
VVWFSLGVVAGLLLVTLSAPWLSLFSSKPPEFTGTNPSEINGHQSGAPPVAITPERLAHDAKLFAELERMFGPQLRWVAEAEGAIEMGIEPDATAAPSVDSQPVTLRLTVVRRGPGEVNWSVMWSVNVLARSEQLVTLPRTTVESPSLLVWTYLLPDGKIACDAELSWGGQEGFHVTASELQTAGDIREVAAEEDGGVEYRVFQTVQLLDDEVI